ncbi:MAG TPA: MerR family transcriptional regulator [Puia sp.]|jgi:DNA-binding transcriptional MerR regulator
MAPAPPSGEETESASQPPLRQYIEAAGVVVRFKSYKNTHKPQPGKDTAPAPLPSPVPPAPSEKIAAPPVAKLPAAEPENQLQIFGNADLFAAEPAAIAAAKPEPETAASTPPATALVTEPEPETAASTSLAASTPPATVPLTETEPAIAELATPAEPQLPQPPQLPQQSRAEPLPRIDQRRTARPKPAAPKTPSKRGRKSLKQVAAEADLIEVPADEVLFSKQYYTMGEVSEMFRVNQSLLRFWETEFDILQPRKNKKGDRYFRPVDIKNLHLIYHLLRQKKYTIEGAKEFLKKNKKADERFEVIQRLQEIRSFLLEWKAQL